MSLVCDVIDRAYLILQEVGHLHQHNNLHINIVNKV
jgi:hypothetical protein